MASIGQLAAGVAHEINNPIGYVHSNLGSLQEYLRSLFTLIEAYERALQAPDPKALIPEIDEIRNRADIDFISRDLPQLMAESREGIERVTRIVRDLKDFSYSDRSESWKMVDLHAGLESTINIIWNELKYKVTLERNYAELPLVECLPSELNQVYMNMLLNAGQAIVERGTIAVTTGRDEAENVWIQFQDSGAGIAPDLLQRIFDPFFSPPSRWAAAPAWACRSPTASSTSTTAASTSKALRGRAPVSGSCCRSGSRADARDWLLGIRDWQQRASLLLIDHRAIWRNDAGARF